MKKTLLLLCAILVFSAHLFSQKSTIDAKVLSQTDQSSFDRSFYKYDLIDLSSKKFSSIASEKNFQGVIELKIGEKYTWEIFLYENEIFSDNYISTSETNSGRVINTNKRARTYEGILNNSKGEKVRLTLNDNFIYGFITQNEVQYFIEPAYHFDKKAKPDQYVVYSEKDVIPSENNKCAAIELDDHKQSQQNNGSSEKSQACHEVELAIASDYSMFQKYGSIAGVENHNVGVMNNVATDYDDAFNHEVKFKIVEQFVVTCNGCDPWTASRGAGDLLGSFRNWGNANGFILNGNFDLGQIWTNRDFNGGTIGVAYLIGQGTSCTNLKYHALQDFSSNASLIRVVVSHEIGHNFSSGHDNGGGFIMSPFVNNTNVWSNNSKASINGSVQVKINNGCFGICTLEPDLDEPEVEPLVVRVVSVSDETCAGYEDGEIQVLVEGGKEDYLYFWNIPGNSNTQSGLKPGSYSCSVVDALNSLAITETIVINGSEELLEVEIIDVVDASCDGELGGSMGINITGGTPIYIEGWSNRYDTEEQIDLPAGYYDVTVFDSYGCSATSNEVEIKAGNAPDAVGLSSGVLGCNNSTVVLDGAGSSEGSNFIYYWTTVDGNILEGEESLNPVVDQAGTYTLTVTNTDDNCETTIDVIVDSDGNPPMVAANVNGVLDCNNTILTIDGSGSDEGDDYSYNWSTSDGNIISGADSLFPEIDQAGTYSLLVSNLLNGCTSSVDVVVEDNSIDLIASIADTEELNCTITSMTLSASPNSDLLTYFWTSPDGNIISDNTSSSIDVDQAGQYTVTILDPDTGCDGTSIIEVNQNVEIPLAEIATSTGLDCNNTIVFLFAEPGGTSANFVYTWTTEDGNIVSGENSINPEVNQAGTYNLVVTNTLNGCTNTTSINIAEDIDSPIADLNVLGELNCAEPVVSIVSTEFDNQNLSYTWSTVNGSIVSGLNSAQIDVNSSGTYTLVITNVSNGCSDSESIFIDSNAEAPTSNAGPDINYGCADSNYQLSGSSSNETNLTYNWTSNDGSLSGATDILNPFISTSGTYTLVVTNQDNGCSSSSSIVVAIDTALPFVDAGSMAQIDCSGANIFLNGLGSSQGENFEYLWTSSNGNIVNGANTLSPEVSSSGTYLLTIINNLNSCQSSESVVIEQAEDVSFDLAQISQNLCFGDQLASASVSINSGLAPFQYNWSNGMNTMAVNNLSAGEYNVVVTDANDCSHSEMITISEPSSLTVTSQQFDESAFEANDGEISLFVEGGLAPYSYAWTNGQNGEVLSNLTGGTYTVIITDANGCMLTESITISAFGCFLDADISTGNTSCFAANDGALSAQVTGAGGNLTFEWTNSSGELVGTEAELNGLSAGTYNVLIADENNCTLAFTSIVEQPTVLEGSLASSGISLAGASDGMLEATIIGGTQPYTYLWSTGATSSSLNNLTAGLYSVIVTDANSCELELIATIEEVDCDIIAEIDNNDILCYGENGSAAVLEVIGGIGPYSYQWSNGDDDSIVDNLAVGTHFVTVTDAADCTFIGSVAISQPEELSLIAPLSNVSANGMTDGSIGAIVSGGVEPYNYMWSNGAVTSEINNLSSGTYSVIITDANGCVISEEFIVTEPSALLAELNSSNILCFGDSNGSATTVISSGTEPYTYLWSDGSTDSNLDMLAAGLYTVVITDATGLSIELSTEIIQPDQIITSATSIGVTCIGDANGSADITAIGGVGPYEYIWDNNLIGGSQFNLEAGSYQVSVIDANGCSKLHDLFIGSPEEFAHEILISDVSCFGGDDGEISVGSVGGNPSYTYQWSNGMSGSEIGQLTSGEYSFSLTDAEGCNTSQTVFIGEPLLLEIEIESVENSTNDNNDGSINISANGGTPPYNYSWSNGMNTEDISSLAPGDYILTITDANGCESMTTVTVTMIVGTKDSILDYNKLNIYPNPSNGQFELNLLLSKSQNISIEVYDVLGRSIVPMRIEIGNQINTKIDLNDFEEGVYFVKLSNNGNSLIRKLVKM